MLLTLVERKHFTRVKFHLPWGTWDYPSGQAFSQQGTWGERRDDYSSLKPATLQTLRVRYVPQAEDQGAGLLLILMKKGNHPIYNQLALSHLQKQ